MVAVEVEDATLLPVTCAEALDFVTLPLWWNNGGKCMHYKHQQEHRV